MQWNELKSHLRHLNTADQKRIQHAFEVGKEAHKDQKRKSGEPYFMHPIAVAHILADLGADADTLIAALLHDTIEDTDLSLKDVQREFNGDVASLIDGVTKLEPEDLAAHPTLNDQIETLRKMFKLIENDVRVIIIKLADRLHNMQTIEHLSPERQRSMAQETMDIYVKIADRLSMQDMRDELESLCLSVLDKENFLKLSALQEQNEHKSIRAIKLMQTILEKKDEKLMDKIDVFYERRSWGKLQAQYNAGKQKVTGVADMVIVLMCSEISQCYEILGLLHQSYARETLSFQDFINASMINGYKGLHTTIILETGTRVRCKIRTEQMHEYAHEGVASLCFDDEALGVMDYLLPWTQHIAPLSKDTSNQSEEFWESLQNDILGESIIIHGADDKHVIVPTDSTALDGAFYCYGNKALYAKSIQIDGNKVPFYTPLKNASSLSMTIGKQKMIQREWLHMATSGLATAMIRNSLSQKSQGKKYIIGKDLLQNFLTEHKRGYIEEFEEKSVQRALEEVGYHTLPDAYTAIADGHLEPSDVYESLFEKKRGRSEITAPRVKTKICFTMNFDDVDSVTNTLEVYKRYGISLRSVRFRPFARARGNICVHHAFTTKEQKSIVRDLETAGVENVKLMHANSRMKFLFGAGFLLLIWGFDPAVAHFIVNDLAISPVDLTLLRFWSLTALSGAAVLWKKFTTDVQQTPIPLRNVSLWISAALMISISFMSYFALQGTQPAHYSIPMTAGGILLTTIVNRKRWVVMTTTWILLICGVALIAVLTPAWTIKSMIYMFLAVASFSLFSVVSERYKREENIGARAMQYFFVLSVLCTVLTLPFIALSTINTLPREVILEVLAFSMLFAGLPYYMYYSLLSYKQIDFVLRYSFIIIFTTILGQILFSKSAPSIDAVTLISGLVVTVGAILPMVLKKREA